VVRRLNTTVDSVKLAQRTGYPLPLVDELVNAIYEEQMANKRQPRTPAPEGGIHLSAASKRYHINHGTISRWARKGLVPVLLVTKNETYIDEEALDKVIRQYRQNPGQGKRTLEISQPLRGKIL